ncbi:unnamed protein product [Sphagnum balticum]
MNDDQKDQDMTKLSESPIHAKSKTRPEAKRPTKGASTPKAKLCFGILGLGSTQAFAPEVNANLFANPGEGNRETELRSKPHEDTLEAALNERWRAVTKNPRLMTSPGPRDRSAYQPPGIDSLMIEKPLTLTSLNVRGLRGDSPKPKEIKAWLASLPTPLKSSSSKNIVLGRKAFIVPPKELSFGKAAPSGMKESPWGAHKGLAQARPSWSIG